MKNIKYNKYKYFTIKIKIINKNLKIDIKDKIFIKNLKNIYIIKFK